MRKSFAILISLLLAVGSARAIVVADYVTATNTPIGIWNLNWDYVYNYKGSSAVVVGSNWLLTAAHVANDSDTSTVVVNGTNYYQQEIIFHSASDDPQHTSKADLALVRFDKAFPGYYPLYTGNFSKRPNAVLIGYGVTGTVYSTSFTVRAWNDSPNGKGIKRWGTQKIDTPYTLPYDPDGVVGMTTNDGFLMNFNSGNTTYEAGLGSYDSGGGTFVNDNGIWKLAGINTEILGSSPTNYTQIFSVSIPAYASWATNVMNPNGDLNGNGLPNYWEEQYSDSITGMVASADIDVDGFSNLQEYIADTDPTNAASFFEIDSFVALADQTVTFIGSTARQYQVFYTTNDLAATNLIWIAAHTNKIWGAGTNSSITVTNTGDKAFYRLKVRLP